MNGKERHDLLLQISSLLRLVRTFGADAPAARDGAQRLSVLMDRAAQEQAELLFLSDAVRVDGQVVALGQEQSKSVHELRNEVQGAGLVGLRIARRGALHLALWLQALLTRNDVDHPGFREVGLVGLRSRRDSTSPMTSSFGIPMASPTPPSGVTVVTPEVGSATTPASGVALPPSSRTEGPPSIGVPGPASTAGLPLATPTSAARNAPLPVDARPTASEAAAEPESLRDVLHSWVVAADAFECAVRGDVIGDNVTYLCTAAERLRHVVERRPDLSLRVHRIQAATQGPISPAAMHAASISALSTVIGRGLELRGEARRCLALAGLLAHLPFARVGRPPSPTRIREERAVSLARDVPGLNDSTTQAGWLAAVEHRLQWQHADGSPRHPLGRIISVAAGYDALVRAGQTQMSMPDALRTLAHNERVFDPFFVTVLTAVLASFR